MFRPGHYGVALALYAPVGGTLLASGHPTSAVAGGAGALWLTMLPDWDSRLPLISHRGPTHTLPFVAAVAVVAWVVTDAVASAVGLGGHAVGPVSPGGLVVGSVSLPAFAAGIAALSVLAHLAADLLTPMGVALLWPASSRRYTLSVTTADSARWNYALFALGVFATAVAASLATRLAA